MTRYLFNSMPAVGHVNPGLPIARALVEDGHEVVWIGTSKFKARIEATGAQFVQQRHARDYDDSKPDEAFPELQGLDGIKRLKASLKHVFIDYYVHQLRDIEETLRDFPADVVIGDNSSGAFSMLRQRRNIPWAAYGVTPLTMMSKDTPPFGLGLTPGETPLGKMRDALMRWLVTHVIFRDVQEYMNQTLIREGLTPSGEFVFNGLKHVDLFLQPTVQSFEYPRTDLPSQFHFVGPFLPAPDANFKPPVWWDEMQSMRRAGRKIVHVTQGTLTPDYSQLLIPTLKALANENVYVVATTGGMPVETVDLKPLPENVRLEVFLPHFHLLPHVDLMVTNAGYGGVNMALANGVPLVASGTNEDKADVSARVQWSGVGVNLRTQRPSVEQVRDAVRKVLSNPAYKQRAEQFRKEVAETDAATTAVALLEELARTRKPVTQKISPVIMQRIRVLA